MKRLTSIFGPRKAAAPAALAAPIVPAKASGEEARLRAEVKRLEGENQAQAASIDLLRKQLTQGSGAGVPPLLSMPNFDDPAAVGKTVEAQLAMAKKAVADLYGNQAAFIRAEATKLADEAGKVTGAELVRLNAELQAVTAERDELKATAGDVDKKTAALRAEVDRQTKLLGLLEKQAGLFGLSREEVVPSLGAEAPKFSGGHPFDQYQEARQAGDTATARKLYRAHKTEIREAARERGAFESVNPSQP